MAREVLKTHDLFFSGRPALYVAKKLSYGCVNLSFAPFGEYWREVRKFVILELLGPKKVQMFQSVRDEEYDGEGEIGMSRSHELLKESVVLLGGLYVSDFLPWISWINKFSGLEQRVDK
ncbi:putative (+)-menthofuran synthase [Rosa chinensis]|uniref:Putative (+)-menthofuran synthase n=1 Tax=Rosa chinensis TaxID=74649 RepID=A0A2P6REK2_ROSCH|nr:putative (+)-menthofuran synthase [Rosa chinensis]